MAGTLWIPGAERITPSIPGGKITSTAPPRVVWHSTEADPGTSAVWGSMIRVLKNKSAEPHILYDPLTDRLGQFLPLNTSGRALRNDGTYRTNRTGKVCIQVEVIARAAKPFTGYWKPGKNWRALMAAIRSHGIPDVQPSGVFPKFVASPPHNVPEDERSRAIWLGKAGHYSHSQIPGNNHGDPGGVSFPAMLAAAPPTGGTMAFDATEVNQIRAACQAENEEYAIRFWIDPTGTGTGIRNLLAEMKLQLDRIEDDTDSLATSRQLLAALDENVNLLASRPALAALTEQGLLPKEE
jgi:hypothetical protein